MHRGVRGHFASVVSSNHLSKSTCFSVQMFFRFPAVLLFHWSVMPMPCGGMGLHLDYESNLCFISFQDNNQMGTFFPSWAKKAVAVTGCMKLTHKWSHYINYRNVIYFCKVFWTIMSRVGKKVYFIAYYFVLLDNNKLMRDITQKMWRLPEYLQEQLFKKKAVSFMSEQTWQIISFLTFKLYSPGAFDRYYVWFVLNLKCGTAPLFPPFFHWARYFYWTLVWHSVENFFGF